MEASLSGDKLHSQLLLKKLYYSVVYDRVLNTIDDSILKGKYMELDQYSDVYENAQDKWEEQEQYWAQENIVIPEQQLVEGDWTKYTKPQWRKIWQNYQETLANVDLPEELKAGFTGLKGKPIKFLSEGWTTADKKTGKPQYKLEESEKDLPIDAHLLALARADILPKSLKWVYKTTKYFGLPAKYAERYHEKVASYMNKLPKINAYDKMDDEQRAEYYAQLKRIERQLAKLRKQTIKEFVEEAPTKLKVLDESVWKSIVVKEIKAYAKENDIKLGRARVDELYADFIEDIGERENLSEKYKNHLKEIAEEIAQRLAPKEVTHIWSPLGMRDKKTGEFTPHPDLEERQAKRKLEGEKNLEGLKGKARLLMQQLIESIAQPGLKPHKVTRPIYHEETEEGYEWHKDPIGEEEVDWRSQLRPKKRNWDSKQPERQIEYDPRELTDPKAAKDIETLRQIIQESDKEKQLKLIEDSNLDMPQIDKIKEALKTEIAADKKAGKKKRSHLGGANIEMRTRGEMLGELVRKPKRETGSFRIAGSANDWGKMRYSKYEEALGRVSPLIQNDEIDEAYLNMGKDDNNILRYWLNEVGVTPAKYRRMGKAAKATVAKKIAELNPPKYPEPSRELNLLYNAYLKDMGNSPLANARNFAPYLASYVDTVKAKFAGEERSGMDRLVADLIKFEKNILPKLVEMVEQGVNINFNTNTVNYDFTQQFNQLLKPLEGNRDDIWAMIQGWMFQGKSIKDNFKGVVGVTELEGIEDRIKDKLKTVVDVDDNKTVFDYLFKTAMKSHQEYWKDASPTQQQKRKRVADPISSLLGFSDKDIKVETQRVEEIDWLDHKHALYSRFTPNMNKEAIAEMKEKVFAELTKTEEQDDGRLVRRPPTDEEKNQISKRIDDYLKEKIIERTEKETKEKEKDKSKEDAEKEDLKQIKILREQLEEGTINQNVFNRAWSALGFQPLTWSEDERVYRETRLVDTGKKDKEGEPILRPKTFNVTPKDIESRLKWLEAKDAKMQRNLDAVNKKYEWADRQLTRLMRDGQINVEEYTELFEELTGAYNTAIRQMTNRDDFRDFFDMAQDIVDDPFPEYEDEEGDDIDNMYTDIGKLLKADVGPILESLDKKKKKKLKVLLSQADPTEYFGQDFLKLGELVDMLKQLGIVKGDAKLKKKIIRYEDENIKVVKLASRLRKDYEGLYQDLRELVYPKSGGGTR